jgi:hypothetical protein
LLEAFMVEGFGGLTLRGDAEQVGAGQALDLLNVTFAQNGSLLVRDGYAAVYTGGPAAITNLWPSVSGLVYASFNANSVKFIDVIAGTVSSSASIASQASSFATIGTATYYTDGPSVQVKKHAAGSFSSPAGLAAYTGRFLAVQPLDNRLVIAGNQRVTFSDPNTPETIDASNFVDLTGDNEQITGLAVYGTSLFVFKKTKFYVFYGNSTDADGGVVFNYRLIDAGVGCWQEAGGNWTLTASHRTGVYFVAQDGVYRTTGDAPERVSDPIAPVFKGSNLTIPPSYTLDTTPVGLWGHLAVSADKLYLNALFGGNGTYVLDLFTGQWTANDWIASAVMDAAPIAGSTDSEGFRGGTLWADTGIYLSNRSKTTDAGAAINWRYLSGLYQLSDPGRVAVTQESRVWGTGTVTLQVANDHGSPDTGSAITLGATPATLDAWQSIDREGTFWQHRLSGAGQATVNRLAHYVRFVKPAGVQ